jgi:DUF1009 family protein
MNEPGGPLAIICGGGKFPFVVADAVTRRGREVLLFAVRGWADPSAVARYPHHWDLASSVASAGLPAQRTAARS